MRYHRGIGRCCAPSRHIGGNSDMNTPDPSYREIPLTQGQVAIVDATDYEWLMRWKWTAHCDRTKNKSRFYAIRLTRIGGKQFRVGMHREILGLGHGDKRQSDHINLNTLDNRRANLRIATSSENGCNRTRRSDNTSGFKGVYPCKNRWYAQISIRGHQIYLGSFKSPEDAYVAYCDAAARVHGEFARTE